jgi:glycosyltransferase involved in cell wall biosynthesis
MKLIVLIGTDCHLELLPHFLEHYSRLGVDLFLCGLHGQRRQEARGLLARYPFEVVADFGTEPYDEVLTRRWTQLANEVRRRRAAPGEWCLYADVDELHEYPPGFLASLDTRVNAVIGRWVERLATSDGELRPCLPDRNIGQQYPFATQTIFCGISQKVMAVRADLDLMDGYHAVVGGGDQPVYVQGLRVHHFRWDDRAAAKYASISWTRHYELGHGRVPDLTGVFYVNPPFPPVGADDAERRPRVSVILPVEDDGSRLGAAIRSVRAQTLADWELIVVDGGSGDAAGRGIAAHADGDERVRFLAANGSLTAARHRGFLSARGGYVYCLDADRCCLPDTLERLCECLDTELDAAVAYGAVEGLSRESSPLEVLGALGTGGGLLNRGAIAIRGSALRAALADPQQGELDDWSLWWSLLRGGPVAFVEGRALSIRNPAGDSAPSACAVPSRGGDAPEPGPAPGKLAYLIIAHHQPRHLGRLIDALRQEDSHFFIHVDAKADLSAFQALTPRSDTVTFVADRARVEWGEIGVVQAALHLLRAAVASGHSFRYFTLLSGSDYPVKHRQAISARLLHGDRQYLRIDRRLTDPGNTHAYLLKDLPDGRYFDGMVPCHGSMYWSLTADCVRFILGFLDANPGYLDVHRHVRIPDEVFFHTLVKHSPFSEAITQDFSTGPSPDHVLHGNHFIDWGGLRRRERLTLDERDFDDLLASDALFARKLDESRSGRLLDLLDLYVHGAAPRTVPSREDAATLYSTVEGQPLEEPARSEPPPAVSCICLTYARPELLEEAIYSFLRQDYAGTKELIVLNDYDEQVLELDHPEVLVVNLPRRLRTVGEKMNLAVALAAHDTLFVWDDDDIYLPHRLTFSMAKLAAQPGFFKPDKAWMLSNGTLQGPLKNLFHVGSCWTRRWFDEVSGYPAEGTGYDLVFERRLKERFGEEMAVHDIRPEDIYYIYRWGGTGSYHMSAFGGFKEGGNVGHRQVDEYVQSRARRGGLARGRVRLTPCWRQDYLATVAAPLRSAPAPPARPALTRSFG